LNPDYNLDDELFICDVLDAIPKDDIPSMEHPIFTLATQPDMREIHYEHNGTVVDIWPSRLGLATIHDKDILIYCISQLIAKKNKGEPLGRTLKLQPHQLLTWARRQTSGDGYRRLVAALDRLSGTRIKTNIKTMDGIEFTNGVGLITEYSARRSSRSGQIIDVQITLSPWLFKMVEGANVLTLHRDYFLLRKPLDRRIYELARKHCGSQAKWSISAEILKKKTGAGGTIRHFREEVRRIVETNHLPDYVVEFADDVVTFFSRAALAAAALPQPKPPLLNAGTFEDAKRVAPGYDVYALHEEWVDWWREGGCEPLKDPAKAFVGFCRHRAQRSPLR
jgi:plasmid replication initiation protein